MHGLRLAHHATATTRAHFPTALAPALASARDAATHRAAAAALSTAALALTTSALAATAAALAAAAHSSASGALRGQLSHL